MQICNRVVQPTLWGALAALFMTTMPAAGKTRTECEQQFQPRTGQAGKDVIWVPTNDALVRRMLQMAQVNPADRVYDLGAGDGKIALAAARQFGARSVGVEYDPQLAQLAQCYVEAEGLTDRVRIVQGDIFQTDFSTATVVTLYLLPELNLRLRPALLAMQPGTRVVSHSFLMDDWEPDERSLTEDGSAYLWIVPAKVAGTWLFQGQDGDERFVVQLEQKFQQVTGSVGQEQQSLTHVRLRGSQIEFSFPQQNSLARLAGRVEGRRIDATVTRGNRKLRYIGTLQGTGSSG